MKVSPSSPKISPQLEKAFANTADKVFTTLALPLFLGFAYLWHEGIRRHFQRSIKDCWTFNICIELGFSILFDVYMIKGILNASLNTLRNVFKPENKNEQPKFHLLSKEEHNLERILKITKICCDVLLYSASISAVNYRFSSSCEDLTIMQENYCNYSSSSDYLCQFGSMATKFICPISSTLSSIVPKVGSAFSIALGLTLLNNFSDISSLTKDFFSRKIEKKIN